MSFGKNYSERTKKINAYYREEFAQLRKEIEDENYFKKMLFLSFLYKDTDVVKEVKKDFNANKSVYFELNKHISNDATILHIADDYGQKDVLLTLYQAGRRIFSLIKNDDKRATAAHNYLVKRRKIHYIEELSEINKNIDVLLVSDDTFTVSTIQKLPETIIFVNTTNTLSESENYTLEFSSESIKVFKTK